MGHQQRFEIHVAIDSEPEPVMLGSGRKTHPEVKRILDLVSEAARGRVANMHPSVSNPHAISFTAWPDGAERVAALVQKYPGVIVKDRTGNVLVAPIVPSEAFATVASIGAPNEAVFTEGHANTEGDDLWGDEYVETGVID